MTTGLKNSLLGLMLLVSGILGFYVFDLTQSSPVEQPQQGLEATSKMLPFAFPDRQGILRHSDEWSGKILVLNFWATWCDPCKREIPAFIQLQKTFADQGVQFVGLAMLDEKPDVIAFAQSMGMNYPVLIGGHEASTLSMQLGNTLGVLPYTVITDRSGHIQETILGELSLAEATRILKNLVK